MGDWKRNFKGYEMDVYDSSFPSSITDDREVYMLTLTR